jgi:hypothetical protein
MRKAIIGILLLAGAAVPAMAQSDDGDRADRARARYERQDKRSEARAERRAERIEQRSGRREQRFEPRAGGFDRAAPVQQEQRYERTERRDVAREAARVWGGGDRQAEPSRRGDWQQQRQAEAQRRGDWQQRQGSDSYRRGSDWRQRGGSESYRREWSDRRENDRRDGSDGRYDNDRRDRDGRWNDGRWNDGRSRDGRWSGGSERYGRGDWGRDRRWNDSRYSWNRDWRSDRRYDWYNYRNRYSSIFRPGRYYAPYRNYRYNRLSIGFSLGSAFYSDRYWIGDPWQYRLPPAYDGTRWVRYYDDVLLVDIYSGEVVDVIYDFFW